MTSPAPVLVAVAHGTSSAAGRSAIGGLVAAVAARRPDLTVRAAFVDVQPPGPATVLSSLDDAAPARLVPLLLSAGYHVYVDLAEAAAAVPGTTVAPALGPDDRLAGLLLRRLEAPACVTTTSWSSALPARRRPRPSPTASRWPQRSADCSAGRRRGLPLRRRAEAGGCCCGATHPGTTSRRRDLSARAGLLRRPRRQVRRRRRRPPRSCSRTNPHRPSSSTSSSSATSADEPG